jgi:hypothetical protein
VIDYTVQARALWPVSVRVTIGDWSFTVARERPFIEEEPMYVADIAGVEYLATSVSEATMQALEAGPVDDTAEGFRKQAWEIVDDVCTVLYSLVTDGANSPYWTQRNAS